MTQVAAKPDGTQTPDPASDSKVVEDAIQTHLDAFNALDDSHTPDPPVLPEGDPPPKEDPLVTDDPPAGDPPPKEDPPPVVPAEEAAAEASTLPAAYRRTAKARGWTDEEYDNFAKADSTLALKTFERMHDSRTKEIQEWADLGRKAQTARQSTETTAEAVPSAAPPVTPTTPTAPAASQFAPVDIAALTELYGGNEELVRAIVDPINERFAAMEPFMQNAVAVQAQIAQTQQETLGRIVQEFFASPEIVPYKEAYGTDLTALTPEQTNLRGKVLETADALLAGAAFQGRELSVQDALALAHDSESSSFQAQVIRDQLRKDTTKREKAITLRPTAQGRQDAGGPPRDRTELLARTEDRLRAAFG